MVREHVAVKDNVQIALLDSVLMFSKGKKSQKKIIQNTKQRGLSSLSFKILIPPAKSPHNYQKELFVHSLKCGAGLDGLLYKCGCYLL